MADISTLLNNILTKRYALEVRKYIVEAIQQCYDDMLKMNPDTAKILSELKKIENSMSKGDKDLQESINKLDEWIDSLIGETTGNYNSIVDLFDYCGRLNQAISSTNEEINQLSAVLDVAKVTSRINSAHIITGATNYALQGFTAYGRALCEADAVTPDNVSEVKVTDNVSLVIAGRQLVNLGRINKTVNGINISTLDGVATIDGKAEVVAETILLDQELTLPPGSYYIASNCDDNRVFAEITLLVDGSYTYVKEGSFNITGKESVVYFRLMLDPTANEFFNDVVIKPMLCSGTSESIFEPFKGQKNSYSVRDEYYTSNYFAGVPVTANGNFIDINGQEWVSDTLSYDPIGKTIHTRRIQRFSVKEYLGGDVYQLDVSSVDSKSVFSIPSLPIPLAEGIGICNALPVGTVAGSTIITTDEEWPDAICVTEDGTLNFFSSSFTTFESLEEWFAENDIILYYPLAEPVVIERAMTESDALLFMYADYSMAYTKEGDMFTLTYVGQYNTLDEIVLNSCTEGSAKKFLVKIDDNQNIIIEEL